jgi:Na+/H+ antiporter NhaD/arsenite permease-like protein
MEINGTLLLLESLIENLAFQNELLLSIIILITTSLLSGFLDNTPVTIIFIPIIEILIASPNFYAFPLFVAFILGVNLGGNFLPQGSPADLMILELGRANNVKGLTYKKMVKTGGSYAFLHILLGIGYLTVIVLCFP